MPVTARRTFSKVNSAAITARQPDVPNLICVLMRSQRVLGSQARVLDDGAQLGQLQCCAGNEIINSLPLLASEAHMSEPRIVLTTVASKEQGQRIARAVVESHAAACVNITGPIESVYWWQGKVESASEHLLIIKTMADAEERVRDTITHLHSYELPEIITLKVDAGSRAYLDWIAECVSRPAK